MIGYRPDPSTVFINGICYELYISISYRNYLTVNGWDSTEPMIPNVEALHILTVCRLVYTDSDTDSRHLHHDSEPYKALLVFSAKCYTLNRAAAIGKVQDWGCQELLQGMLV